MVTKSYELGMKNEELAESLGTETETPNFPRQILDLLIVKSKIIIET